MLTTGGLYLPPVIILNFLGRSVSNFFQSFCNFRDDPIRLITTIVFFMPVFFLTIKSWVTTSLFLLFFISAWLIVSDLRRYFLNRNYLFWGCLICLLIPFLSELCAQVGRGEFVSSNLDGPSRMILAASIFIYLSRTNCYPVIKALSYGSGLGVVAVWCSLIVFPGQYWQHRAATYFVDPITLPCFTVGILGLALFWKAKATENNIYGLHRISKMILVCMTVYIVVDSYSRSAWVAMLCLLVVYIIYSFRSSIRAQITGILGLMICVTVFYYQSDIVYVRVNEAFSGLFAFLFQSEFSSGLVQQTSTGHRILLGLIDIYIVKSNLIFGVGDRTSLPPYSELLHAIPMLSRDIYEIRALAGSHTEVLAQLVRQGLLFGSLTLCSLFLYPIYLLVFRYRNLTFSHGSPLIGLLGIVIPIFASSLTIQVFNLKMTISFYALCLAIFFAYLCQRIEKKSSGFHQEAISD